MEENPLYIDCILPVPINQHFTYHVAPAMVDKIQIGCRVIVQFGTRKFHTAIVRKIHNTKPAYDTKPVESILDENPLISEKGFQFWQWIAEYYCCTEGEVMKAALPSGLKLESQTSVFLNADWIETEKLTGTEEVVY
jgi:primosomal protein N' (replication factor Y) (superfamily II helicase)